MDPIREKYTYKGYVAVGADTTNLINPTLNASVVGMSTQINNAQRQFCILAQAGIYGTAKFAGNAFAYMGLAVEARGGQTLGTVNAGVRIQFQREPPTAARFRQSQRLQMLRLTDPDRGVP